MNVTLADARLLQLSDFIASQLGLYFPSRRWDDLKHLIASAATQFGFPDTETFLQRLLAAPLTQAQIEILASHLTISESYFWREPRVFEALRDHILPELIRARKTGSRRLRIWSAGCAAGEEPYSIAIVLRQLIPNLKNWNITLLSTDINPEALRRAAAGKYSEWSFRGTPPEMKAKYFCQTGSTAFEILPDIRQMVTFSYLNLAQDINPSPVNNTNGMDIIFCRNVLMYFTAERAQQVGEHLYQSLAEGGWLIVSSSELSQHLFPQSAPVHFPGVIIYRREALKPQPAVAAQSKPVPPPINSRTVLERDVSVPEHQPGDKLHPGGTVKTAPEAAPPGGAQTVRSLANQGKLGEAWNACEQAIAADKLNPGLYYLGATILQELNREDEAMATLKCTLYLDPNFVPAHFFLGNLSLRQGNQLAAKKSFENALDLLNSHGQNDILPESEGLTAGRLREIIRATLHTGGMV